MRRIIVCGDRHWKNSRIIEHRLAAIPVYDVTIVHGAATGADSLAGFIAEQYHFDVERYPAEWDKYGKAAGFIRNNKMLDLPDVELVIAFHDDIDNSRGTKHCITEAFKRKIPVEVHDLKGNINFNWRPKA